MPVCSDQIRSIGQYFLPKNQLSYKLITYSYLVETRDANPALL